MTPLYSQYYTNLLICHEAETLWELCWHSSSSYFFMAYATVEYTGHYMPQYCFSKKI